MAWVFCCSMLLQPERCLLPCCCTYNAFFMDLPGPSFVSHSSLLTTKGVNFVVGPLWLQFLTEILCNFHRPRFSTLQQIFIMLNQELMSHQRWWRSMKLTLPAGCHHNPNCLPISFLIKKLKSHCWSHIRNCKWRNNMKG